jgi:DNA-directed RNA polymerase subunit RPC12/RpoP
MKELISHIFICSICKKAFRVYTKTNPDDVDRYICPICNEERNKKISKEDEVINLNDYRKEKNNGK